ncbi:RPM1-interacting 4-like protein [Rhynchospora pubera]|uniref:RPM1-interacting 4-like protein n=1 Tax=Rhynchospora pubera TaxID=906938 RepID=A0AAV8DC83_9POAL|nr:RPM1-interacting 4-like protein [Rhynchospora pubera]KAJ4766177.1 RPM1-interacting 4-like protein [Rhynchospora pubera]KAJ4795065.1 RPM1-interacting 4-like protein [Rhynchospora pubera]KAJ4818902.1 RPM1-interacting 4-like protein [Rhynchospora pubera]
MEKMRRSRVPAFGDWNTSNEFRIPQYYFDSIHDHYWIDQEYNHDRFYVSSTSTASHHRNVNGNRKEKQQVKKQRRISGGAVKPVDEDLYKIPPELLYPKSKKKKMVRSLWSGCMRVTCVA